MVVTPLPAAERRLVVFADGSAWGTLGDPSLDAEACRHALDVMRERMPRTIALDRPPARMKAFFELHAPPATLLVYGATHVAMPLARMAKVLGWRVIVADGRERFATRERFPDADEIRVGLLGDIAAELPAGPATFVVLMAHDYKFELPVLRAVLAKEPAYIGLLGSRRRGDAILDWLRREGISDEALGRIHVPVGLDIGARSPAEIALSVLAEAVAVRARRPGSPLRDRGSAPIESGAAAELERDRRATP